MALDTNDLVAIRGILDEAIEERMLPRFDQIDRRLDAVEERLEVLELRLEKLESNFDTLKREFYSFRTEVGIGLAKSNLRLETMEGKLESLEADVKEIYHMLDRLQKASLPNRKFLKLKVTQKILYTNKLLIATAKEAGITLPRQ